MDDTSKQEILEAINGFASHVQTQFDEAKVDVQRRFDEAKVDVQRQFGEVKAEISAIKANMVTRDYLDEKLADMRGDLVVLLRKEDNKLGALITELIRRDVITQDAAVKILSLEPFPQMR